MSWGLEALAAIKRIILLEERIKTLGEQSEKFIDTCRDLDRRLIRLEAKFELLERMAAPSRRSLLEKSEK